MNLTDLARVRDKDLAGEASAPEARTLMHAIMSEEREPVAAARPHPKVRRRLAVSFAAGLSLATAAAVAVIAPTMRSDSTISVAPSVSATAEPTARQILLAAAVAVEKAPASGDYWRTATVNQWMLTDPTRSYVLEGGRSAELWLAKRPDLRSWRIWQDLGVKPATPRDEAAWRAAGAPSSWRYPKNMKTENLFSVPSRPLEAAAGERTAERLYVEDGR